MVSLVLARRYHLYKDKVILYVLNNQPIVRTSAIDGLAEELRVQRYTACQLIEYAIIVGHLAIRKDGHKQLLYVVTPNRDITEDIDIRSQEVILLQKVIDHDNHRGYR